MGRDRGTRPFAPAKSVLTPLCWAITAKTHHNGPFRGNHRTANTIRRSFGTGREGSEFMYRLLDSDAYQDDTAKVISSAILEVLGENSAATLVKAHSCECDGFGGG